MQALPVSWNGCRCTSPDNFERDGLRRTARQNIDHISLCTIRHLKA